MHMYSIDWDEKFPDLGDTAVLEAVSLSPLYDNYINSLTIFGCPSYKTNTEPSATGTSPNYRLANVDYAYRVELDESDASDTPIVCDEEVRNADNTYEWLGTLSGSNHKDQGGNVLYIGGHVKWISSSKWLNETYTLLGSPGSKPFQAQD